MTIDTTTGLPYTGDAPASAGDDPFAGMVPGRAIGRMGLSGFPMGQMPGKVPGEGAPPPPVSQGIYTPPVQSTVYTAPVNQGIYAPQSGVYAAPVNQGVYTAPGPIQYVPPEQTWIPGVPNFVTGVTALALSYALYKTFFEAPRSNPSDPWGSIERKLGSQFVLWATPGDESSRYAIVRRERFSGLRWERYSVNGHLIDQSGGAFYDTGDAKDHPEGAVEWARQSAIKAHQKAKALLARENPNNRGRPTLKEVEEAFGDSLRHEYGDKAKARAKDIHAALQSGPPYSALESVNRILHGHGIEEFALDGDLSGAADAVYINMGDLYNTTVIYDVGRYAYVLTGMGTWRSQNEKS